MVTRKNTTNLSRIGVENMKEIARFNAILLQMDMDGGRKELTVVDADTGEIVVRHWKGGMASFGEGYNAAYVNVLMSREQVTPLLDYFYIRDAETDELLHSYYSSNKKQKSSSPKHSGGKKTYTGFSNELVHDSMKFADHEAGYVLKFSGLVNWKSGRLEDKKTHEPYNFTGLMKATGYKKDKLIRCLAFLKRIDYLKQSSDGYFISKDFVGVKGN